MPINKLVNMLIKLCLFSVLLVGCDLLPNSTTKPIYTVALTQFADTAALVASHTGIIAGLKANGYSEGKNLKIIFKSAKGDLETADEIAEEFIKLKPNLIISLSTPSTLAVVKADQHAQIPVVFSTVTDPVAAKIVPNLTHSGGYVTGVYDLPPVAQQVKMIHMMMPSLQTIGVVYNPSEVNSTRVIELFKNEPKSFKMLIAEVSTATAVPGAVNSLMGKVDALYIPQDNTVQSAITAVLNITFNNNIPVFASDNGSVSLGALAAIADNQYDVGYLSGRMAASVLSGKDPGQMDVVRIPHPSLFINIETADKLNIKVPEVLFNKAIKY